MNKLILLCRIPQSSLREVSLQLLTATSSICVDLSRHKSIASVPTRQSRIKTNDLIVSIIDI